MQWTWKTKDIIEFAVALGILAVMVTALGLIFTGAWSTSEPDPEDIKFEQTTWGLSIREERRLDIEINGKVVGTFSSDDVSIVLPAHAVVVVYKDGTERLIRADGKMFYE